jgi:hypothetical protein
LLERGDERVLGQVLGHCHARTMRVSPAINRADSIRHTASIARWVADGLTRLILGGLLAQPLVGLE